eukprot:CAMPEP_0181230022 /NCGR_PEP_ID=MMETSP1096-20121128/34229_1 /TAXON_ID=156174 ORGANISM="Chrysochromulina ericina, Strain CCMP281" /NCGR_SAMPLE_ID=MMETSP1096 /ASSEMBLY_ACC=CAM_ASM_000453 /LENGTH=111 /DNA_ID=CAMNT_0023323725 /DNA_START=235 /DNA_END=566 /DNA_ORIENTATION=+
METDADEEPQRSVKYPTLPSTQKARKYLIALPVLISTGGAAVSFPEVIFSKEVGVMPILSVFSNLSAGTSSPSASIGRDVRARTLIERVESEGSSYAAHEPSSSTQRTTSR